MPCNVVQEQAGSGTGITDANGTDIPTVNVTFTKFWAADNQAVFFDASSAQMTAYNCEFWNGLLGGNDTGGLTLSLQNCLLENSLLQCLGILGSPTCSLTMQNCTSRGGWQYLRCLDQNSSWSITVKDSAFDGTQWSLGNTFSSITWDYNVTNIGSSYPAVLQGSHDFGVHSFNWQTGPLGDSYLPDDPPAQDGTLLIDAGDNPASSIYVNMNYPYGRSPLAVMTTQTSRAHDVGTVDIGYHYAAGPPLPGDVLVTGNNPIGCPNDDYGDGPIQTYDFADGSLVNFFAPQGAVDENWGRGLAIYNGNIYYTEVLFQFGFAPSPNVIHICSYGTQGSGATTDNGTISNPDTRHDPNGNYAAIQNLAFHYDPNTQKNELFAMTGYPSFSPEIFEIDPTTKTAGSPIPITGQADDGGHAASGSDGFTVLPSGHFLINEGDSSPIYDEYTANGVLIPVSQHGLRVDLRTEGPGFSHGYGVATAPDGTLYFNADQATIGVEFLVHVDSNGNFLGAQSLSVCHNMEDIDVLIVQ